jgi:hypothetical protein
MQDSGYELLRNPIPRTWVNKGKKEGRDIVRRLISINVHVSCPVIGDSIEALVAGGDNVPVTV